MSIELARALRRALVLLTVLTTAALLAGACGGDNDDGGSSKSSDSTKSSSSSEEDDDGGGETSGGGGSGRFCGDGSDPKSVAERADAFDDAPEERLDAGKKYTVAVKTSAGDFSIQLNPKAGPIAAANFAFLARNCFYDGVVFHRIIKGFMVQTGDPMGTGTGGPGYSIKDDAVEGTYARGVVAMANAGADTGGSQFFVVQGDSVQLPPSYAIFGKVSEDGMATIDKIADTPVETGDNGEPSSPTKQVKITSARLEES